MVLLHATMKPNACPASAQFRPKEVVTFDSHFHDEFKKRYNALLKEQSKPKMPIRTIVIMTTLVLCVLNVIWNFSIHHSAAKVVEVQRNIAENHHIGAALGGLSNLRGSTYEGPNRVRVVTGPPPTINPKSPNSQPKPQQSKVVPTLKPKPKFKPKPKPRPAVESLMSAKFPRPPMIQSTEQTIPIYYVNLDRSQDRREYIEAHLAEQHLKGVRVAAVDNIENVTVGLVSPMSMLNPNNKELACIASHLIAIHKAVNDQSFFSSSPYAIIIEDDVKFEFPVNWNELIYNAPGDFDVLQFMTSNWESVTKMAEYYDSTVSKMIKIGIERNISEPDRTKYDFLWESRLRGSFLWSTQAYAVRKDNIRHIINKVVTKDESGGYSVTIKNTPNQIMNCRQNNANSCKLLYPYRLVADIYLYDLLGVAYTLRLPLFNGVSGYNSSIQSEATDKAANISFTNIAGVVNYVHRYSDELLPTKLLLDR